MPVQFRHGGFPSYTHEEEDPKQQGHPNAHRRRVMDLVTIEVEEVPGNMRGWANSDWVIKVNGEDWARAKSRVAAVATAEGLYNYYANEGNHHFRDDVVRTLSCDKYYVVTTDNRAS